MSLPPFHDLTPRQRRAAQLLDRNLNVIAGAGTGKTQVLGARLLAAFERAHGATWTTAGVHGLPHALAAVTFTRKAGAEMRTRVAAAIGQSLAHARASGDVEKARHWARVRRTLDEATIGTVHGLASQLVGEMALETGVDPDFQVVEGAEQHHMIKRAVDAALRQPPTDARAGLRELSNALGASTLRRLLEILVADAAAGERWADFLLGQSPAAHVTRLIEELVPVGDAAARALVARISALLHDIARPGGTPDHDKARALAALGVRAAALATDDAATHAARVRLVADVIRHASVGDGSRLYTQAHFLLGPQAAWARHGGAEAAKGLFVALCGTLAPWEGRLRAIPGPNDERMLAALCGLALAFRDARLRFQAEKRRRGLLDYHDLEAEALALLSRGPLAEELRRRLRHILVDEAQDTNDTQWRLFAGLAAEPFGDGEGRAVPLDDPRQGGWASAATLAGEAPPAAVEGIDFLDAPSTGPAPNPIDAEPATLVTEPTLGPDRLFLVGDPKQSIYAFRGADVSVYQRGRAALREANRDHGTDTEVPPPLGPLDAHERAGEVVLDRNFRSLPALVAFTNALFDRILAPDDPSGVHRPDEAAPARLEASRGRDAVGPGTVRLLVSPNDVEVAVGSGFAPPGALDAWTPHDLAFRQVADDLARRLHGPAADAFLIEPKKKDGAPPEPPRPARPRDIAILLPTRTHLKRLEAALLLRGVPFSVTSGRGFWSRQEVWDLVSLLAVLDDPEADLELLAILRSPFFAWSDEAIVSLWQSDDYGLYARLSAAALPTTPWQAPASFHGAPCTEVVAQLGGWRRRARAGAVASTIEAALADTGYVAALAAAPHGAQAGANVGKLCGIVRDLEARQGLGLRGIVRELLRLLDQDDDESEAEPAPQEAPDAVQIMTIHAAKGLEFPVVYLLDLARPFPRPGLAKLAGVVRGNMAGHELLALRIRGPDGELEGNALLTLLSDENKRRQRAEMKRLFYVGVTRARDHLVMHAASRRVVAALEGENAAPPPLDEGGSWLDWLENALGLDSAAYAASMRDERQAVPVPLDDVPVSLEFCRVAGDVPAPKASGATVGPALSLEPPLEVSTSPAILLSPSHLEAWHTCEARFRYGVIEGLPEARVRGAQGREPDRGRAFGTLVHRALATGATAAAPLPPGTRRTLRGIATRYGWDASALETDLARHVRAALRHVDPTSALAEVPFDVQAGPGVRIAGVIDALIVDGHGKGRVVDYKTDAVRGAAGDAGERLGYADQVRLYDKALALAGAPAVEPAALLFTGSAALETVRGDGAVGTVLERLAATRALASDDDAARERLWPRTARDGRVCAGCGHAAARGGPCPGVP